MPNLCLDLSHQVRPQFQAFIEILLRFTLVSEIYLRQSPVEICPGEVWIAFDRASEIVDCFRHFSFFHPRGATSLVGPCHLRRETNCAIEIRQSAIEVLCCEVGVTTVVERFGNTILECDSVVSLG